MVSGLLEDGDFDLVVAAEKWWHNGQRCFAVGTSS